MGVTTCRIRTDPEETIVAVAKQVQQRWPSKMILEKTPIASHQSIGGVERFHRMIQDQVRTIKIEVEQALKTEIASGLPVVTWIVRHASWLLYRYHKSRMLKSTCYTRDRGVPYNGALVKIFETILARVPGAEER